MRLTVIGLSLLMMVAMVTAEQNFMAVFTKELRNGMDFVVDVTMTEPVSKDTSVFVYIRRTTDTNSELVWPGAKLTIKIAYNQTSGSEYIMVPYNVTTGEQYYVHLLFSDSLFKPMYEKVVVTRPSAPILAVTDKPIYNPGQEVFYRVVVLDMYLRPEMNKQVTVEIKDGNDNSIMKTMSDPIAPGLGQYGQSLVDGSFELSDFPVEGTYKVIAMTSDAYTEITFEVKEYVLPKFEAKLELDQDFLLDGENVISGRVSGIYSYGKNVLGSAVVKVASEYGVLDDSAIVKDLSNFDGSALFTATFEVEDSYPWMYDYFSRSTSLKVSAEVMEENTGIIQSANITVTVYPKAFVARIKKPLPMLFQGISTYILQVELTDPMYSILKDWDAGRRDSNDLSHYELFYKASSSRNFSRTLVTSNPQTVTLDMKTSDTSLTDNAVEVYFEYTTATGAKIKSPYVRENIAKYYTWSQQKIEVKAVPSQNENARCFKMTSSYMKTDKVYYQIINNYYPEEILPYEHEDGYCFRVYQEHAPQTRIVLYKLVDYSTKESSGTELLTAYVDIDITWTPEQTVTLDVTSETGQSVLRPSEMARIVVQTNGSAVVGLKGVDKSVSILAGSNDITKMKLLELIEAFRPYGRKKENKFANPPMFPFPRGGPMPLFRKKRCAACIDSDQYMDPKKLLDDSGLTIITNLELKRQEGFDTNRNDYYEYEIMYAFAPVYYDEMAPPMADAGQEAEESNAVVDEVVEEPQEDKVREDFPETWLWDLLQTDENGVKVITKEVPDTITTWELSAFAMNSENGLSVSETEELTVFQPLFISLNLPYSVVRGEVVGIPVIVFNYDDRSIDVDVEVEQTSNYTVKRRIGKQGTLSIPAGTSKVTIWLVEFETVGEIPIKAVVREHNRPSNQDTVKWPLLVKPEGRQVREDDNLQISGDGVTEKHFNMSKFYRTGFRIVPGSFYMYLFVTGDMMGVFISNLATKIRMPSGCGEQNIKSLTPGVFISRYLKLIDRTDPKLDALIGKVCGTGYRKELNYMHADGSYSAFGDRPNMCICGSAGRKYGSTWLTAYVLKVFSLMYLDDLTYVSPDILRKSFDYISDYVTFPNCDYQYVVEKGELIHTEMQGGTGTRIGLVGFVLIAVMDYKDASEKAGMSFSNSTYKAEMWINGASIWLRRQMSELMSGRNTYQMAIVAYALARASNEVDALSVELLDAIEEVESDGPTMDDWVPRKGDCIYKPSSGERKNCTYDPTVCDSRYEECCMVACETSRMCSQKPYQTFYRMPGVTSTMIEAKGYQLLAYLELYSHGNNIEFKRKAEHLKEWLLEQRKANGFFQSTQDTVVAMEALARFASAIPGSRGANFGVRAKADGEFVTMDEVKVNSDTYTVTTEVKLDVSKPPMDVSVMVSGTAGTAFVNLVAIYNVNENVSAPPYDLIIELRRLHGELFLRVCFKTNPNFSGLPGTMIVKYLELMSGYTYVRYVEEDEEDPEGASDRLEIEQNTINMYYMEKPDRFSRLRCSHVFIRQDFEVENPQPAVAGVLDYYVQDQSVEVLYSVDPGTSTEYTTTPVTTGASCSHVNMFLLFSAALILLLRPLISVE